MGTISPEDMNELKEMGCSCELASALTNSNVFDTFRKIISELAS